VTRDLDWGIDVPVEGAKGIIRGLMLLLDISRLQKNGRYVKEKMGTVLEDHTKLVHFIGKDNIVFHCIIFLRC
jgi:methionyl-tRNA synthetase